MTISPRVELLFHPTDLNPKDLARAGQFLGSPAQALEAGLIAARMMMVERMKVELEGYTGVEMDTRTLTRIADTAWQVAFWRFRKISAPVMADAYVRAYRRANAGDVPIQVIYDLADRHSDRIGEYFHQSSKEAMVEGFNTYVNRRMGARAAADRVMDAYGLTPRQMRGYTAATASLEGKVTGPQKRSLKAKVRDYIVRSFRTRIRKFVEQEEHNIDQQAQQFAWMWLVDKGRLSAASEKVWITAKDEKVCKVCGPLHGQRVGVNEKFSSSKGDFWTPGVHPNCRCFVRLIENTFTITKAYEYGQWVEREHPRGDAGRFTDKPKPRVTTKTRTAPADAEWLERMRALARADVLEAQPQTTIAPLGAGGALGAMAEETTLGAGGVLGADLEEPTTAPVAAPAKPGLAAPVLGGEVLGAEVMAEPEITVDSLMEANPALSMEHLTTSSLAYDEASAVAAPVQAPAPEPAPSRTRSEVLTRNVYDFPGDLAPGGSQPIPGSNLVYYYDDHEDVNAEGDRVQFTSQHAWLRGDDARVSLYASAINDVNDEVKAFVEHAMNDDVPQRRGSYKNDQGEQVAMFETPDGKGFEITDSKLYEVATDIAMKSPDAGPVSDIYWWDYRDPNVAQEYRDVPQQVIANALNITPELFEKTIYVTGHGYDEQAVKTDDGSRLGHEVWANPGEFETTSDSTGVENQGPLRVVHVEPIVEVERDVTD